MSAVVSVEEIDQIRSGIKDPAHLIHCLARCTFLPGSCDKRFVKSLQTQVRRQENTDTPFVPSEKQAIELKRIAGSYRKQLRRQGFDTPLDWSFKVKAVSIEEQRKLAAWNKAVTG